MTLFTQFSRFIKTHKLLTSLTVFVTLLVIGVVAPTSMSDGLEKFGGVEQEVARQELETYVESSTTSIEKISSFGVFKYRVESVEHIDPPSTGVYADCDHFYRVHISEKTLFGVSSKLGRRVGCVR
jgi:hypothetical protein